LHIEAGDLQIATKVFFAEGKEISFSGLFKFFYLRLRKDWQ